MPLVRSRTSERAIERDGQVLEDQGEDGRAVVGDDARGDWRDVDQLGARRLGDDVQRRVARLDADVGRDALALLGGLAEDLPVDRAGQVAGEEPGVVGLDRVDHVDPDVEHRLLAGAERGCRVLRRDDHDVQATGGERLVEAGPVGHDGEDVEAATRELLVLRDIGGQARRRRHDDRRLERAMLAAVPEAEERHDQERAQDEADDGARATKRLDDLLADEGKQPDDRPQQRRSCRSPAVRVERRDGVRRAGQTPRRRTGAPPGRW